MNEELKISYIGGPTALIENGGLRFVTDPTFDPAPAEYPSGASILRKTQSPSVGPEVVGRVDAVLLSHDHHDDNLDRVGRAFLSRAGKVITTKAAAERLKGNAVGLEPWQAIDLPTLGGSVRVTATPARHGPAHMDRGPVIGFVLEHSGNGAVYVAGDTVWYEGVEEVARRYEIRTAVLNLGAARVAAVGPWHLTMTAKEAVELSRVFAMAEIVPLHFEGWEHFSEGRKDIEQAFREAGLEDRLRWASPIKR
jgi:L-ascorbate metabolism protein UlaG (beta-lactamase superfamily)